jgi:hypothetical protein
VGSGFPESASFGRISWEKDTIGKKSYGDVPENARSPIATSGMGTEASAPGPRKLDELRTSPDECGDREGREDSKGRQEI